MNLNLYLNRTSQSLRCMITGLALVLFALVVRLVSISPAGVALARLDADTLWSLAIQCLAAEPVSPETASTAVSRPEKPPKDADSGAVPAQQAQYTAQSDESGQTQQTIQAAQALTFAAQEADAIAIGGSCTYEVDKTSALLAGPQLQPLQEGPAVLIVHTHTTEAYTPEEGWEYEASAAYRTLDPAYNMIRIGDEIAQVLEQSGIGVVHDATVNDYPDYNGAYSRSYACIEKNLAAHPSIQVVLDIHRDAAEDAEGQIVALSSQLNGQSCAQVMLVVGTDEGGLTHPNWQRNFAFAMQLQALIGRDYPDLCRALSLRTERFNQNLTPGSILVEIGTSGNTMEEALLSARCFAQELARYLLSGGT